MTLVADAPAVHRPTEEQQAAIDAFATGGHTSIVAGAGSGKTATLRFIAETVPNKRGLYLAFNKSVAIEAKQRFRGTNVEALTVNQVAYRAFGAASRDRMEMKRLYPHEKKRALGMPTKFPMGTSFVSWQKVLRLTQQTLETFCRSFRPEIELDMVQIPATILGPKSDRDALAESILRFAQAWWKDWLSPNGLIEHTHSTYMKRWALSAPQLEYDYLLVDEAQDLEPLTRGMLLSQNTQVVTVGDPNQAIYGWRGASNALDDFDGHRTYLTQSWRFGDAIAEEANFWLSLLESEMRLRGKPGAKSSVWKSERRPEAILTRTNGGAMQEIIASQQRGIAVGVAGERKKTELVDLAKAALDLQRDGKTKHRELDDFTSWADVIAFVEDDGADSEIAALVRVVDSYGAPAVVAAMENTVPLDQADQTVSTVHVAKGLEWFHCRIADDFREPGYDKQTNQQKPLEAEEARLAYVAVTRAERHLDASGLDWARTMTGGVAL
ncbi:UvrD-helicase domain-containing protein [Microbacterium sp. 77mftsu3.1]|uniref:UvrD-helicase domain-containing protein n=1 Tax=Microbacterium sp. 77mftsu3.1 TaxID=1761802 RepID=UPI000370D506|nr:UvrD-helicase domain-containing protein [Microbacterium sp. 77mftsu3.1]SDH55106.1 UvrD/REP helicase N-terminal domain-containing protein [Microbacterium sp. 77mftsu3.1]